MRQLNEKPFDYGEKPGDKKGYMQATRTPGAKGSRITDDKRLAMAKYLGRSDGPKPRKPELKAKWAADNPATDPTPYQHKDPTKRKEEHERLNKEFEETKKTHKAQHKKEAEKTQDRRDLAAAKRMDALQDKEDEVADKLKSDAQQAQANVAGRKKPKTPAEREAARKAKQAALKAKNAQANEEFVEYFGELYDFLMD